MTALSPELIIIDWDNEELLDAAEAVVSVAVITSSILLYTGKSEDDSAVEQARLSGVEHVIAHRSGKALLNRCHSIRTSAPEPDDLPF